MTLSTFFDNDDVWEMHKSTVEPLLLNKRIYVGLKMSWTVHVVLIPLADSPWVFWAETWQKFAKNPMEIFPVGKRPATNNYIAKAPITEWGYLCPLCFHHFSVKQKAHRKFCCLRMTADWGCGYLPPLAKLSALPLRGWVGWLENREDVVSEFWTMTVFPQYSYL